MGSNVMVQRAAAANSDKIWKNLENIGSVYSHCVIYKSWNRHRAALVGFLGSGIME